MSFTATRDLIFIEPTLDQGGSTGEYRDITVDGVIDYARRRKNRIGLTTEGSTEYLIAVEEGMDDIVRSSWNQYVTVVGVTSDNRLIFPRSIQPKD